MQEVRLRSEYAYVWTSETPKNAEKIPKDVKSLKKTSNIATKTSKGSSGGKCGAFLEGGARQRRGCGRGRHRGRAAAAAAAAGHRRKNVKIVFFRGRTSSGVLLASSELCCWRVCEPKHQLSSDVFGRFRRFQRLQTFSDVFKRFRMLSDIFERFRAFSFVFKRF